MDGESRRKLETLYLSGERDIPLGSSKPSSPALSLSIPNAAPEVPPAPQDKAAFSTAADPQILLNEVRADIGDCRRCRLCEQRTNIVFGVGNPRARLMFVGEGPGRDEDKKGEPFVGRAGQLLDKIIGAMGMKRADVYIANVVKCRPPENRNPAPDEIETCGPYLFRQIEIIQPRVIVGLGNHAVQTLMQTEAKITGLRGRFHPWPSAVVKAKTDTSLAEGSIRLMPTYHPAFLLRNPAMKRPVWEDMQKVMEELKDSAQPITG